MTVNVYGIDFTGSQSPGQKIWIAEATLQDDYLRVLNVRSAVDMFDVTQRDQILERLRELIGQTEKAVVGIDFPFGFSQSAVSTESWSEFLSDFATTFKQEGIEAFPGKYETEGRSKREIDHRYGGQSPLSPQVKYQVFFGLRDVLHPLVSNDKVRVAPMQAHDSAETTVIEVYPAATFGAERLYRTGYKYNDEQSRRRRRENAIGLREHENMIIENGIVEKVTQSDHALDSLCAAFAVRRALNEGLDREHKSVEGHIYA